MQGDRHINLEHLTPGKRIIVDRFGKKSIGTIVRKHKPLGTLFLFTVMMESGENTDVPWYQIEEFIDGDMELMELDQAVGNDLRTNRFADVNLNDFIGAQKNKETDRKTKSNMKVLREFLQSVGETRDIKDRPIEPLTLNKLLSQFMVSVRKQNGQDYEPNSLRSFVSSFERYLRENEYGFSLITSLEFSKTREALKAKQIALKKDGKGNKPHKSEPITDEEIGKLFDTAQLGKSTPNSVLNTLWLHNSTHFGLRGVKEHRQLQCGDVSLKTDSIGREFLEYSCERQTKTRTGANPRDTRSVNPRMYATQNPDRCPVDLYKFYSEKRPESMSHLDAPFYIAPKSKHPWQNEDWYKNQCVGENKLSAIMRSMKSAAGLSEQKKLTNTSARKYVTQKLVNNNVAPTDVMQTTGHKNVQSILNYSSLSEQRQLQISGIIDTSDQCADFRPSQSNSLTLSQLASASTSVNFPAEENILSTNSAFGSLFSGCAISGGTINVNFTLPPVEKRS